MDKRVTQARKPGRKTGSTKNEEIFTSLVVLERLSVRERRFDVVAFDSAFIIC